MIWLGHNVVALDSSNKPQTTIWKIATHFYKAQQELVAFSLKKYAKKCQNQQCLALSNMA